MLLHTSELCSELKEEKEKSLARFHPTIEELKP